MTPPGKAARAERFALVRAKQIAASGARPPAVASLRGAGRPLWLADEYPPGVDPKAAIGVLPLARWDHDSRCYVHRKAPHRTTFHPNPATPQATWIEEL